MEFPPFGRVGVLGRILPSKAIPRVELESTLAIVHLRMRSLCRPCVDNLRRMQGWGLPWLNSSCASAGEKKGAVSLHAMMKIEEQKRVSWGQIRSKVGASSLRRNAVEPKRWAMRSEREGIWSECCTAACKQNTRNGSHRRLVWSNLKWKACTGVGEQTRFPFKSRSATCDGHLSLGNHVFPSQFCV